MAQEELSLREAVHELGVIVTALKDVIENDYLQRSEGYEKFTKKSTSKRRWLFLLSLAPILLLFSIAGSVTTISVCFLDAEPHPGICEVIPGYVASQERNIAVLKEFRELQEITQVNESRIEELETQVKKIR